MPDEEYRLWVKFFEERPLGWREDLRTFLLLQSNGEKRKPYEIFPSLEPVCKPQAGMLSLKNSALFSKMLGAQGGDKLNFEKLYDETPQQNPDS